MNVPQLSHSISLCPVTKFKDPCQGSKCPLFYKVVYEKSEGRTVDDMFDPGWYTSHGPDDASNQVHRRIWWKCGFGSV